MPLPLRARRRPAIVAWLVLRRPGEAPCRLCLVIAFHPRVLVTSGLSLRHRYQAGIRFCASEYFHGKGSAVFRYSRMQRMIWRSGPAAGVEMPRSMTPRWSLLKAALHLIEPREVGRRGAGRHVGMLLEEALHRMALCVEQLSGMTCALRSAGRVAATSARNARNSWLGWREPVWPMTSPARGFSAVCRENVPWRRDSKPCFSARPGDKGRRRSSQSKA